MSLHFNQEVMGRKLLADCLVSGFGKKQEIGQSSRNE